jgi:RHS repeat-associated protein
MDYTYGGGGAGVHAVTQITSGSSIFNYKYDPAGNQIIAPTRQIRFTSMNLPSRITSAQHDVKYKYDAFGNRALKQDVTTGGATTYVNGLFEKRTASGTTNYVLYLPVENRIIGEILMGGAGSTAGAQTFYFHDDLLGSIETVSDSAGNGIERFAYSSFGVKRSQVPASGQPEIRLGFTGAQEDKEFGLVNLVGRIYDPQIGRFLSPDPFVPHPYSGQSYNRYSYVLNNPLTMTDPNGFQDGEDTSQPTRGADFGPSTITGSTSQDTSQPTRSANFGPSVITGSPSPGPPANTSDDTGTHADSGPSNVPANLSPPRVPLAPLFRPLAIQQGADLARTGYERGNYAITASRNAGGVIKQVQSNELTPSAGEELAVQLRRDLEGQTRSNLPSWAAELSAARNLERYGDPLGPATPDLARVRPGGGPPKTPMEVMRSSGKTSAVWNAAGIVAGVAGTVLVIENWLNMAFTATDRGYIPSGAFNVVVDPSKIPNGTQTLDWPGVSTPGVFWNGEFRPYTHMEPGVGTPVPDML